MKTAPERAGARCGPATAGWGLAKGSGPCGAPAAARLDPDEGCRAAHQHPTATQDAHPPGIPAELETTGWPGDAGSPPVPGCCLTAGPHVPPSPEGPGAPRSTAQPAATRFCSRPARENISCLKRLQSAAAISKPCKDGVGKDTVI